MMPPRLCGADLRPHLTDDGDPAAGVAAAGATTAAAAAAAVADDDRLNDERPGGPWRATG